MPLYRLQGPLGSWDRPHQGDKERETGDRDDLLEEVTFELKSSRFIEERGDGGK